MISLDSGSPCALCSQAATVALEPPRRTLGRGPDPDDPSYSVTVVLPDIPLCLGHASDVRTGNTLMGWCDDEHCRIYGEIGETSPCGQQFIRLIVRKS